MATRCSPARKPRRQWCPPYTRTRYATTRRATWFGLFAPSATPREIVVKLNAETVRGLNAPDTKEKMAAQGMFTTTASVEEFGAFVKKETVRWGQIVKDAGVKPQ